MTDSDKVQVLTAAMANARSALRIYGPLLKRAANVTYTMSNAVSNAEGEAALLLSELENIHTAPASPASERDRAKKFMEA